ncbi:hypothetical protein BDZ91DRAFT_760280 [Kalaharituber pfeilii]|nr:hypothetical protein BDZ91DRAFT_760280 [Kalaharituber pfeilii]
MSEKKGELDPTAMMALEVTLNIFTLGMALLRFWILRHRRRMTAEKVSDVFFALSICISFANLGEEMKLRKEFGGIVLELKLFAPRFLKMTYIFGCAYLIELFALKAAFIAFYWGLFQGLDYKRKYSLHIACVLVTCGFLACWFTYIFWARPIEVNWSPNLALVLDEAALASFTVNTIVSALNIATDLIVISLPLLIISTLRLRRPEKLALVFVFSMGGLSIAASVARYAILYPYIRKPPLTIATLHVLEIWGTVEMAAGALAFSLPSLRALYIKVIGYPSHVQATPQGSSDKRKRSKNRSGNSTSDTATTWTIGGSAIDGEGNRIPSRKIMVKKTFDVQREAWPPRPEDEDDVEMGVMGSEGPVSFNETAGRRSAMGFGGHATAEVGSLKEGSNSQEMLRPHQVEKMPEQYSDSEVESQDTGNQFRQRKNSDSMVLPDRRGRVTESPRPRPHSHVGAVAPSESGGSGDGGGGSGGGGSGGGGGSSSAGVGAGSSYYPIGRDNHMR